MEMPESDRRGIVKTLNNFGYMQLNLEPITLEFLDFIPEAKGNILEIGAAYGIATQEAVKHRRPMLVNDLDPRHLQILYDRLPEEFRPFVTLMPGAFPVDLKLQKNSVGAVLASRVFHFLVDDSIEQGLKALHRAMVPGGKAFLILQTPYNLNYKDTVSSEFESRLSNGDKYQVHFPI